MRALKLTSNKADKTEIGRKCRTLVDYAEEIKKSEHRDTVPWSAPKTSSSPNTARELSRLKSPRSNRQLSTREQIVLLEGSKLHGSVFPPWKSPPEPSEFDLPEGRSRYVYVVHWHMLNGFSI